MYGQQKIQYHLSEDHPVVKLFNWMKSQGHFKDFKDFEDYRARRNNPVAKEKDRSLAILEAAEKARILSFKIK